MSGPVSETLRQRLAVFRLDASDIAVLQSQRSLINELVPSWLAEFDHKGNSGPQMAKTRLTTELVADRNDYWCRLASGDLDDDFIAAADRFAELAYAVGVPSGAHTIKHSGVQATIAAMVLQQGAPRTLWWFSSWRARRHRTLCAQYEVALGKAAWFGLSVLLEADARAAADQKARTMSVIEASFGGKIAGIADLLGQQCVQIESAVQMVSSSAQQSLDSSEGVAREAKQASMAARSIAAVVAELATSVESIDRQIAHCADTAQKAADQAALTDTIVAGFTASTAAIDGVVAVISRIADQVKLLALNATIEAAHAGDAGRGFAVVASEIKVLALETTSATRQIAQQVGLVQSATHHTAAAVYDIAGTVKQVSEIAASIAGAVAQQGTATRSIAQSLQQAAVANEQVSQLTTSIETQSAGSLQLAERLAAAAAGIGLQSSTVRDVTQSFMTDVRAA